MITLRLHGNIYSEASVEAAVAAFTEYATVEMSRDAAYWVVRVENEDPDRARLVAHELGNMALGLSIDAGAGAR
jgi:hypothetical protein